MKPSNILVSLKGPPQLKLIDFGISRHFQTGTPKRTDIYGNRTHLVGLVNYASLNAHDGIGKLFFLDATIFLMLILFKNFLGGTTWSHCFIPRFVSCGGAFPGLMQLMVDLAFIQPWE